VLGLPRSDALARWRALPDLRSQRGVEDYAQDQEQDVRAQLYQCLEKSCKTQFSATSGTIFHDSHLPLNKKTLRSASGSAVVRFA
jgi:hypothetical protein